MAQRGAARRAGGIKRALLEPLPKQFIITGCYISVRPCADEANERPEWIHAVEVNTYHESKLSEHVEPSRSEYFPDFEPHLGLLEKLAVSEATIQYDSRTSKDRDLYSLLLSKFSPTPFLQC